MGYIVLVFFVISLQYFSESLKAGHAIVAPESFHSCEGGEKSVDINFKKGAKNTERIWDGEINFPFNIDSNTEFVWEFRWWKDGAWEKNAKVFKGKVCYYLSKFANKVWKEVREAAKPPIEHDCPIKADKYTFTNVVTDFGDVHLPMVGKGRWLGKISVTKEGKTVCGNLIVDMI